MTARTTILVLAMAFAAIATAAQAQTPQSTVVTYGDWSVRCNMQSGNPPQKSCDLTETFAAQGKPAGQLLIVWPNRKEPVRLVMELPSNVLIAPGVKFTFDDKQPPLTLPITRCFPNACFASAPLTDDLAKRLHARTEPGRLEYKDGNERDVAISVSFNGFAPAFDAWLKQ